MSLRMTTAVSSSPHTGPAPHLRQWAALAAILAALCAVTAANLYAARLRTENIEQNRLLTQAQVVKENLQENLAAVDAVLASMPADIRQGKSGAGANPRLRILADAMPGIRTLAMMDAAGTITDANWPALLGKNLANRDYFMAARNHPDPHRLFVSQPYETVLGVFGITVAKPILGADGRFAGIAAATLDPTYFGTLLASVLYAPDMWTAIAHGDGLQFMMVPERPGQAGKNLAQPNSFFTRHRESGREANIMTGTVLATGEVRMMAMRTVQSAKIGQDKPLVVAVGRDLDAIYAQWNRDAAIHGALLALISIGAILALRAYQRRHAEFLRKEDDAARALAAQARFLMALTDNVPGMIAYWDRDLVCRYANRAYKEWFGRSVDEMIGATLADVLGPQLFALNAPHAEAALRGEAQVFERAIPKPDGQVGYTLAQYVPDRAGEQVEGFFALVTDITRQRHEQEDRVAALVAQRDVLVREVHHRIKNNLQVVGSLLRRQLGKYEDLRGPLEQAITQVDAVASIHGLQGRADTELLRLADLATDVAKGFCAFQDAPPDLRLDVPTNLQHRVAKAEAVPLALILNELLRNAAKHGSAGPLEVSVEAMDDGATIRIGNAGAALPAGFEFATGKGLGTGLGLVRALMPLKGAALRFDCRDGKVFAELELHPPVLALVC